MTEAVIPPCFAPGTTSARFFTITQRTDSRSGGIGSRLDYTKIIKIKIHSSCEIEYFIETHLCKLCVIFDRAYYGLCVLIKDIGRRLPFLATTTV